MKKELINDMTIKVSSKITNDNCVRSAISSFLLQYKMSHEDLKDIKAAVSEAFSNSVSHAYKNEEGKITVHVSLYSNDLIEIKVSDKGCGIEDVKKVLEPLFTTGGDEHAGLGFTVMESFMDSLSVHSKPGKGTEVKMTKHLTSTKH